MELLQATTPSPSSSIRAPPTPRLGYEDPWDPYSPRKSARLAQRASNRTPSPQSSTRRPNRSERNQISASPKPKKNRNSSNKNNNVNGSDNNSATSTMVSPAASPHKKRMPTAGDESSRMASGSLTAESAANAAAALGLPGNADGRSTRSTAASAAGMLPTPAKTPQKPPTEQSKASIRAVARNLFHNDDQAMPSPRKTRTKKQHVLDSFELDEADEAIQIYTDSHERIPEVDRSTDNPFYDPQPLPATEPAKRRSKRQQVTVPGEGRVSVDDAIRREDGMLIVLYVYQSLFFFLVVFFFQKKKNCAAVANNLDSRGKKEFRKFSDNDDASGSTEGVDEGENGLEGAVESNLRRPLTRSSVKPRLLFPVKSNDKVDEDEEAVTDIEDHSLPQPEEADPQTPSDPADDAPGTPLAPKFAPASPPATTRTTRHSNKVAEDITPMKATRGSKRSPFDGWRRVKSSSSESHGQKRPSNAPITNPVKRARN